MSTRWVELPVVSVRRDAVVGTVTDALVGGATVALAARFVAALLTNVPAAPSATPVGPLTAAATLLSGAALVAVGLGMETPAAGVGPLFAGVFGLLAVVAPAAAVPAAAAIAGGTAICAGTRREAIDPVRGVALVALLGALAGSLVVGVAGVASARPLTSTLSFLALGTLPAFVTTDRWSLVQAAVAFLAVVGVGLSLPFVTGAVTLVGTGAVGTALPVVGVAVAGVVTAGSAALRARRWPLVAAIALLGVAGVPVTIPRAVPFALGLVVLVGVVSR